jgi:hypothetical protein
MLMERPALLFWPPGLLSYSLLGLLAQGDLAMVRDFIIAAIRISPLLSLGHNIGSQVPRRISALYFECVCWQVCCPNACILDSHTACTGTLVLWKTMKIPEDP